MNNISLFSVEGVPAVQLLQLLESVENFLFKLILTGLQSPTPGDNETFSLYSYTRK